MDERLFSEIEGFLANQAGTSRENRIIEDGLLLFILTMRGTTVSSKVIEFRARDRDARWLTEYLLNPGLAPDLATAEVDDSRTGDPVFRIYPDWDRIARYYGKTVSELDDLLRHRLPSLVRRHQLTLAYLFSG